MAIKYITQKKRNGINNKELYYAQRVSSGVIGTRDIIKILADRSSLSSGDIRSVLIGLTEVMGECLANGFNIKLDDLGTFSISATSEGFETEEECTPHNVRANRLCFIADPEIKKSLKNMKFEREK